MRPTTTILYVGGFTRSGSTLLAYLLGALEGFQSVGELRELWTKGLIRDNLCSCGERFSACPFWRSVGERAFGSWDRVDVADLAATGYNLAAEPRLIPALLAPKIESARLARFREHTVRVYRAITELTGCSVIVDSSKVASYALLLAGDNAIPLRVIHLVRDSRGVVFSWTKNNIVKPDVDGGAAMMDTYGTNATALRWIYHNALFDLFPLKRIPLATMRYEELAAAPAVELERSLVRVGLATDVKRTAFASGGVSLCDGHTIGGNPMRFRGREQPVRLDDEWRRGMSRDVRRKVTLLTWPFLLRYGYARNKETA
jgi:hypothetical protein